LAGQLFAVFIIRPEFRIIAKMSFSGTANLKRQVSYVP